MHFVCSWERLPVPLVHHDLLASRYQLPNNTLYYYGTIYLLFIPLSLGPTCYPFWATVSCGVLVCPRDPPYFLTRNKESLQKDNNTIMVESLLVLRFVCTWELPPFVLALPRIADYTLSTI